MRIVSVIYIAHSLVIVRRNWKQESLTIQKFERRLEIKIWWHQWPPLKKSTSAWRETFLIWIILENPENENFYLFGLTSFDCKAYIYLTMLFFCLIWLFCVFFSARKRKLVLNVLLIFQVYLFSHTEHCIVIVKTSFEENDYHSEHTLAINSRHFTGVKSSHQRCSIKDCF